MSDETRQKMIQAAAMLLAVAAEWYMMQPYHEPLTARFWMAISSACKRIALGFGQLGLKAEAEYYRSI